MKLGVSPPPTESQRMDPTATSDSEQFKRCSEDFFIRFQALEQENESVILKVLELETKETNLKLKIIELTHELERKEERENNCVCLERQDEQVNLRKGLRAVAEDDMMRTEEIPVTIHSLQTDGINSARLPLKKRNIVCETEVRNDEEMQRVRDAIVPVPPSVDERNPLTHKDNEEVNRRENLSGAIDEDDWMRTEEFPLTIQDSSLIDSLSVDQSLQIPIEFERDLDGSANAELDSVCGTDRDLNQGSKNKKSKVKLKKQKKVHPPKAPHNCFFCNKSFLTDRLLTIHKKTHGGEIDMELPAKISLPVENEKLDSAVLPTKKRKVVSETGVRVCNDDEMTGVKDRTDPPSVVEVEMNIFKKKKILRRILSNLGKHDLLNARMVSQPWNNTSLKLLRKSNFTQLLTERSIGTYIFFTPPNEPRPYIIPFHLAFAIGWSSLSLALHNRILTSHVDSLCQIYGPECVSTLTLTTDDTNCTEENIKEMDLIKCLTLISPGLKTLDLKKFNVRIDFLKNQTITFPNLEKLICNTSQCRSGRSGACITYISIIQNSPKLEDLTLTHPCDLSSWPVKFNKLKSLSLASMKKPQDILKILSSSGTPVLRELSIGFRYGDLCNAEEEIAMYKILKSVSATLKSLKFWGSSSALVRNGNQRFPKLPHLKDLGLEYDRGITCRLRQEKCPSLKSIELPIGSIFNPSPVQPRVVDNVRIEFPNLIKLTLRVNDMVEPKDFKASLEYLQKIFPTPSKLCLVNVEGDEFVNYVLYGIMKSNWSKNIQEIEMIGFDRDDLGGILDRLKFDPHEDLFEEHGYWMSEESLQLVEFRNTMKIIRMEFVETVGAPGSIILRRTNQSGCQNKK